MDKLLRFLDAVPYWLLVLFAVLLAIAPVGNSHLVEKWRMLFTGTLRRPLDWFDLVMHTFPLLLLGVKVVADLVRRR